MKITPICLAVSLLLGSGASHAATAARLLARIERMAAELDAVKAELKAVKAEAAARQAAPPA
ncbi:hypothetical protein, partial [Zoogloea sp.]|uniref:hypothetical protein n=1 Tax=Zoogloea sp. TaxID=49181 RepID=UPI0032205EEA